MDVHKNNIATVDFNFKFSKYLIYLAIIKMNVTHHIKSVSSTVHLT